MKIGIILILGGALFASCDKCKTCTYTDEAGATQTTNETCGNTDEMTAFETGLNTTWSKYGTVACVDN